MSAVNWVEVEQALLVAMIVASIGYLVRWFRVRRRTQKMARSAHEQDMVQIKRALLGDPGDPDYGIPSQPGLVDRMDGLSRVLGSNGGSTVFDNLDELKRNQRTMMQWAREHSTSLEEALAKHGIEYKSTIPGENVR